MKLGGEALGGVGRGERVIRIYCMKKNVFNRKEGIKNHALTLNCGKKKQSTDCRHVSLFLKAVSYNHHFKQFYSLLLCSLKITFFRK